MGETKGRASPPATAVHSTGCPRTPAPTDFVRSATS